MEKWCFSCKECIQFKEYLFFCMKAKNFIPNHMLGADCDFYRKGRYILDNLHANNAMDRSIKKNNQSLSDEE